MSEAKPDHYLINRHLLVGVVRLFGILFLLERVPFFTYSIVYEIYDKIRYQQNTWNSNARLGLLGSIVENAVLGQLVYTLPIILAAVLLIWKAPWLIDRIAPSPVSPAGAGEPTDGA